MSRSLKDIIKGFRDYLGEGVLVAGLTFLLVPILTRVMSVAEYGELNVFMSYVSIASIIFVLNTHSAIARYYYENNSQFEGFLGTNLLLTVVLFSFSACLFINYFDYPIFLKYALLALVATAILESVFRQIYQAQLKSKTVAISGVSKAILILIFVIILSFAYHDGGMDIAVLGRIAGAGVLLVYFVYAIFPLVGTKFQTAHVSYIACYALPLIPYALSNIVLAHFDRIMIQELIDNVNAGLYSFAYNIGFIMSLVVSALNNSIYPVFFKNYTDKSYADHDHYIVQTQNIVLLAFVGLVLFCEEIGFFLGPSSFQESIQIVPIVVLGYVFYSFFSIYNRNFDYLKKTWLSTMVMMIAVLFNIGANYLFIPVYGYIAAAYTTLGSFILLFLLSWLISTYVLQIHSVAVMKLLRPLLKLVPLLVFALLTKALTIEWYISFMLDLCTMVVTALVLFPGTVSLLRQRR
ncbi:PST family polysaccharide transporter [Oleiphilus messinensis]|uniref:PST family polysaccharide transporter n=1 Tax=Oleiphilus messinensis TaxID=141451 RepID=A0A1Y0IJI0_9GAMM|nr:oligosaccharide flippase family protein [Oleiphilus messinensis]ARU59544.1 PST family polysaccharide transporter [Oleiphilus messinensis]